MGVHWHNSPHYISRARLSPFTPLSVKSLFCHGRARRQQAFALNNRYYYEKRETFAWVFIDPFKWYKEVQCVNSVNKMASLVCRLCLNDSKLINIFDNLLTNSDQLKKCILLGTGVEVSFYFISSTCTYFAWVNDD